MTFLPAEAINDPQALHNVFVEMREAYAHEKIPMDKDQSGMLIRVLMAENNQIDGLFGDFAKTFLIGGFFNRMGTLPIKFEKRLLVSLGVIYSDYGIGGLILIGYYLQWLAALCGKTNITTDWVYSEFGPSEYSVRKLFISSGISRR